MQQRTRKGESRRKTCARFIPPYLIGVSGRRDSATAITILLLSETRAEENASSIVAMLHLASAEHVFMKSSSSSSPPVTATSGQPTIGTHPLMGKSSWS